MFPLSEPGRVRVKICGVTHPDDAEAAVALGADALGLNFYPGSPRCLDPARDATWLQALAGTVRRVAVVVNAPRAEIDRLLGDDLVDAVQLHGDEDAAFCQDLAADGIPFAKALRVRGARRASWRLGRSAPRGACSTPSTPRRTAAPGKRPTGDWPRVVCRRVP